MKLMLIVAGDEYADEISSILLDNKYMATVVGSSGDFLQYGYTVLLLGIYEEQAEEVIKVLKRESKHCKNIEEPFNGEVAIYQIPIGEYRKVNAEH